MLQEILTKIDDFVWGPVMLVLLVGTGIFLTIRFKFLPWRNLFPSMKRLFSPESRKKDEGEGDISPFSALMTALAATIGTGNIVGVATAMVTGGPGALVWMWISAAFGISTKFSECALAIKYRKTNEKGEMSGGPMFTIKNAFKVKWIGAVLAFLFAIFAVFASFGIGNLTQANSIADALHTSFSIPAWVTGLVLAMFIFFILLGGIKRISKVSSILVPLMAFFYIICGVIVIFGNITEIPAGLRMIFAMAFNLKSVGGGVCGTITASVMNSMRFGVARGCFSNEAGLGSAAISAAAATTKSHIKQGFISMCGTFIDTIIVCTITGLAIASSGVLGTVQTASTGTYTDNQIVLTQESKGKEISYIYELNDDELVLTSAKGDKTVLTKFEEPETASESDVAGSWTDTAGNHYVFGTDGKCEYQALVQGAALTILAFESVLGKFGSYLVSIGLVLFAFSTIIGWEYNGEKALEYIVKKPSICFIYRVVFSVVVYFGATTALQVVWSFSDIANALMAIPNLICLLVLSNSLYKDLEEYNRIEKDEKKAKKLAKLK